MSTFEEDTLAELAALNAVAITVLMAIAAGKPDPDAYLGRVLEDGYAALEKTRYWSIPPERLPAFLENVKARYTDAIMSARPQGRSSPARSPKSRPRG